MVKATAAQQQCYYIDVNAGGEQGCGLSLIAGPDGDILHDANIGEAVSYTHLTLPTNREV